MAKLNTSWSFETTDTRRADEVLWHLDDEGIAREVSFYFNKSGKRVWRFVLKPAKTQVSRAMQIIEQSA